ncbi:MAG: hypothetical protein K2X98_03910 [Alphaproteobacteria bacterium]|nr:hypothetical protein [Alphaproteobacteria bacterium]
MNNPKKTLRRSLGIFWSLFKIAALIFLALWIMRFPGDIYVRILDIDISMTIGFAVASLLLCVGVTWLIVGMIKSLLGFGSFWKQRRLVKNMRRASENFDAAIDAFFAEDYDTAMQALSRSIKYNPRREGIYMTFLAVSALNSHQRDKAYELFFKLSQMPGHAFMGYFGLYHLSEDNPIAILEQARLKTQDHPWILKKLFDEYAKEGHSIEALNKAHNLIPVLIEKRAMTKDERKIAIADVLWRQARYYIKQKDFVKALDLARQSHDQNPFLSGPVLMLAEKESPQKAGKMLIKAFKNAPTQELTCAILKNFPKNVASFHDLEAEFAIHSSPESQYLLAELAYNAQLWGRAKQIMDAIDEKHYDARFYLLQANLSQKCAA